MITSQYDPSEIKAPLYHVVGGERFTDGGSGLPVRQKSIWIDLEEGAELAHQIGPL